jgi:hypothetical protein
LLHYPALDVGIGAGFGSVTLAGRIILGGALLSLSRPLCSSLRWRSTAEQHAATQ